MEYVRLYFLPANIPLFDFSVFSKINLYPIHLDGWKCTHTNPRITKIHYCRSSYGVSGSLHCLFLSEINNVFLPSFVPVLTFEREVSLWGKKGGKRWGGGVVIHVKFMSCNLWPPGIQVQRGAEICWKKNKKNHILKDWKRNNNYEKSTFNPIQNQRFVSLVSTSDLTLVCPLRRGCDPAAKWVDRVIQGWRAAMVVTVVWVCQTIWRLFAVCLAQQSVEAVVKVSTEAKVSSVAGAVQRTIVVLPRHREQVLVVVGRLV